MKTKASPAVRKKYLDGRKPVLRTLPPLVEACTDFSGFGKGENRTERMYELLAGIIQQHRRATPQTFYAMRDVAAFFEVAVNTVARVYRRLDREGLLTLVRSSQSIIPARAPRPRSAIQGVVCMPIWLPGFLQFLDWRKWFSQLEEELARYHFVLEPIFYKADEKMDAAFVDRVLRFNPDYVLWSWPNPSDLATMHSLVDTGVPLVVIRNVDYPFPARIYHTSYRSGLLHGLKEWQKEGIITRILLPMNNPLEPTTRSVKSLLEASSLPCHIKSGSPERGPLVDCLRNHTPDPTTGVVFGDHLTYARLCGVAPDVMLEFFGKHRVMVMRQVTLQLKMPTPPPNLRVDALVFPWKKLAQKIALDLSKNRGALRGDPVVLEAEWRPQVPLSTMVQTIINE